MNAPIGFMQGRLSPLVDGRIQAFPWTTWTNEFREAEKHGFGLVEWTLDQHRLYENPLMTVAGQAEIRALCATHGVAIPSLTGDCFMQAPFWKARGAERISLQDDFRSVVSSCDAVGIRIVVVPLVDNGRIDTAEQKEVLLGFLEDTTPLLSELGIRVAFESDFGPADLAGFMNLLDADLFGVNYDVGNSAALGFDPAAELAAYGHRVLNVHIKDRILSGTTVPLGTGNADFDAVFAALRRADYGSNYILQTARAQDDDHAAVLCRYRDMVTDWLRLHGS